VIGNFEGAPGDVFVSENRSDVSAAGHLRVYHDLTESTNLDIGASYAAGHNGSGLGQGAAGPHSRRAAGPDHARDGRCPSARQSAYGIAMSSLALVVSYELDRPAGPTTVALLALAVPLTHL
jgi:hypothetical protein